MSRYHGKTARIMLSSRDASGDLGDVTPELSREMHDATTFKSSGWKVNDPGQKSWSLNFSGFHDPASTGIGPQLVALDGTTGAIVSIFTDNATAVGAAGWVYPDGILHQQAQTASVGDLVKISGTIGAASSGPAGLGAVLLAPLSTRNSSGGLASVDSGVVAGTAGGGRANLHCVEHAGTTHGVAVQHSSNNSVWADLITFTALSTASAQSAETTLTVERYTRVKHDPAALTTSTFLVGFGRYAGTAS